jgi:hypothetical protein
MGNWTYVSRAGSGSRTTVTRAAHRSNSPRCSTPEDLTVREIRDESGRLVGTEYSDGGGESYGYDEQGRVVTDGLPWTVEGPTHRLDAGGPGRGRGLNSQARPSKLTGCRRRLCRMPTEHDHGDGLHEDLAKLATRRDALRILGAGSAAAILAALGASNALAAAPTGEVPSETAGPYPGDGSNGPDVLDDSGIVRHDIRRSFGSSRTLAKGVPLRVNLTVTDAAKDYAPLSGLAVYAWHCDRSGRYSMYSSGVEDENYLRGIATTDKAVSNGSIVKTSQIAFPAAACKKVYATSGYSGSSGNLARTSLSTDNVFSDDKAIHQLATVTGSVKRGFVANLTIGI